MRILLLLIAPLLWSATPVKAQKRKPNIIVILADDLGYGELSCYGQQRYQTPNIDRLAKEGMKFTQAYAGTAVCAPSRSSLMTGQHTGHTPIRGNLGVKPEGQYPLADSTVILPQLLKKAGYATGCFGKWGLGAPGSTGDPVNKGIDEFYGYNSQTLAHNYYPAHLWHNKDKIVLKENAGGEQVLYGPDLIHQKTLSFMEAHRAEPFALFITTIIPHAELRAPDAYMQKHIGRYGKETPFFGRDSSYTQLGPYNTQAHPRAAVAATMEYFDDQVGEILQKLKELGLEENTIVIFTSDNGPSREGGKETEYFNSAGGLRGLKRDLYEGGIREPFLVRWPGVVAPRKVSHQPIAFWDLLPTFTQIAGTRHSLPVDGLSILPTLTGKGKQQQHPYFYWEFYENGGSVAARAGKWKAVRLNLLDNPKGPIELYDLEKDRGEKQNIATAHPEVVKQFEKIFEKEHVPSPVFKYQKRAAAVD